MVKQGHRPSTWLATVLVALTFAVSLEPVLHGDAGHDPHFAIALHDESQDHVTALPDDSRRQGAEHCVVCHLFRQNRGSDSRVVDVDVELAAVLISRSDDPGRPAAGCAVLLPARAPPARS